MNVKEAFDAGARTYDRARRQLVPHLDHFYQTVLDLVPFAPDAPIAVLDLGAGTGLLSALIAATFPRAELTLVDISEEMLAVARQRLAGESARLRFSVMDFSAAALPGHYDLVVSGLAIHHLEDAQKRALFGAIFAALRPGGAFINADQVLGATAGAERRNHATWLREARDNGVSEIDLTAALERMKADRMAPLAAQLDWLAAAGFRDVDCSYKHFMFVVYAGFK